MIRKRTLIGAVTAALFLPAVATAAGLNISGSATVASNLIQPKEAQIESAAGVDLIITANGSSHGLIDLEVRGLAASRPWSPLCCTDFGSCRTGGWAAGIGK